MEVWLIIATFAVTAIVVAIVGYIGNKVVDGTTNAVRKKRIKNRTVEPKDIAETQRLADRYRSVPKNKS